MKLLACFKHCKVPIPCQDAQELQLKTRKIVEAQNIFRAAGYGLTFMVLNASFCGVPQRRKRFVMVGKLKEKDDFLRDLLIQRQAKHEMTVAEYFGERLTIKHYYRHPRSYARRGIFSVDEPSPTIGGVNRPMPKGYQLHPGDPVESFDGIRPLTTRERSEIQTFPADFVFDGNKTNQEQMIGNAVPVNLGRFVAKCIMEFAGEKSTDISATHRRATIPHLDI